MGRGESHFVTLSAKLNKTSAAAAAADQEAAAASQQQQQLYAWPVKVREG